MDQLSPRHNIPLRVSKAVELLLDGYRYAEELKAPWSEFAVSIQTLRRHMVADIDIRWLLAKGYIEFTSERVYGNSTRIEPSEFVMITFPGVKYAERLLDETSELCEDAEIPVHPRWDSSRRELKYGNSLVKKYRVPAPNQQIILQTFQEEEWPSHIEDPIPPVRHINPKRRLHDTIIGLNRGQTNIRLRFRGDGTGCGVCWEY